MPFLITLTKTDVAGETYKKGESCLSMSQARFSIFMFLSSGQVLSRETAH